MIECIRKRIKKIEYSFKKNAIIMAYLFFRTNQKREEEDNHKQTYYTHIYIFHSSSTILFSIAGFNKEARREVVQFNI